MITQPENFWRHVQKGDGCWLWTGSVNHARGGYGQVKYGKKHYRAHRLAWLLTFGEIPDGMKVLHRCDTPACCRPDHLFLGSQTDNIHDMLEKGRHVTPTRAWRGPTHPRWKGGYAAWLQRHAQRRREKNAQRRASAGAS
jgi:hypothetical protein